MDGRGGSVSIDAQLNTTFYFPIPYLTKEEVRSPPVTKFLMSSGTSLLETFWRQWFLPIDFIFIKAIKFR